MKTIEERAKAFCEAKICPQCSDHKICNRRCLTQCMPTDEPYDLLVEFAKAEHAELTRWNAANEQLPADGSVVLCKYHNDGPKEVAYCVCQFVSGWFYTSDDNSLDEEDEPTHWREIH